MKSLVGYTGFVGSNLNASTAFDAVYHSKDIQDAYGTAPDLLVYAGMRAEKYLANNAPEKDFALVQEAFDNIRQIRPKKLVLISTVDIYKDPVDVDEDTPIDTEDMHPYGYNRYKLEQMIEGEGINALMVRLPGLYGMNLKKNFLYDLIHVIPSMLTEKKYEELMQQDSFLEPFYEKQENGFFKCREIAPEDKRELKAYFLKIGFSALNFTDSRSVYQFYNLKYLWGHIEKALALQIPRLNIATEPVKAADIYRDIMHKEFVNEIASQVPYYNYKSKYASELGGSNGYLLDEAFVRRDIQAFIPVSNESSSEMSHF